MRHPQVLIPIISFPWRLPNRSGTFCSARLDRSRCLRPVWARSASCSAQQASRWWCQPTWTERECKCDCARDRRRAPDWNRRRCSLPYRRGRPRGPGVSPDVGHVGRWKERRSPAKYGRGQEHCCWSGSPLHDIAQRRGTPDHSQWMQVRIVGRRRRFLPDRKAPVGQDRHGGPVTLPEAAHPLPKTTHPPPIWDHSLLWIHSNDGDLAAPPSSFSALWRPL